MASYRVMATVPGCMTNIPGCGSYNSWAYGYSSWVFGYFLGVVATAPASLCGEYSAANYCCLQWPIVDLRPPAPQIIHVLFIMFLTVAIICLCHIDASLCK